MLNDDVHLRDEELLRFADGELASRRRARAREHLAACWDCRARMAELEKTIVSFVHLHHDSFDGRIPPASGPRSVLKARLDAARNSADEPQSRAGDFWGRGSKLAGLHHVQLYAALLLLALGLGLFVHQERVLERRQAGLAGIRPIPDRSLTPGETRPVGWTDICASEQSDLDPAVPSSIQRSVFREYGMDGAPTKDYEVDYLIAPQLGGTADLRNLWPEPYSSTIWNAHVKDALEDRLHQLVCQQQIDLATAQRELSTDWISAYKKYFHSEKPVQGSS